MQLTKFEFVYTSLKHPVVLKEPFYSWFLRQKKVFIDYFIICVNNKTEFEWSMNNFQIYKGFLICKKGSVVWDDPNIKNPYKQSYLGWCNFCIYHCVFSKYSQIQLIAYQIIA